MIIRIKASNKSSAWKDGFQAPRFKGAKDSLTAFYDRFGSRITGLSKEDEIRLGEYFKQDLSPTSAFWDDFKITMRSKDTFLDLNKPEDELKYKVLKSHFRVKASSDDNKPNADYEIVDENVEARSVISKADEKIKAYRTYADLTSLDKADVLRLYPGYARTDNISPDIIDAKLLTELEKDYAKFNRLVSDINRDMKVFLKDLVSANILVKNKTSFKYGKDVLGHNEDSTIDHLNDPENQGLKVALMKELKEYNSKK